MKVRHFLVIVCMCMCIPLVCSAAPIDELLEKATQGDITSQVMLGNRYYSGQGVEKDDEKAGYWWMKAAEQGNIYAQKRLQELKSTTTSQSQLTSAPYLQPTMYSHWEYVKNRGFCSEFAGDTCPETYWAWEFHTHYQTPWGSELILLG